MSVWMAAIAPAIIAAVTIAVLRASPWSARLADHPNERSLHSIPTPRIGGLGVVAGTLPFAARYADGPLAPIFICALALAAISALDDARSLPIEIRLSAHLTAAVVALLALSQPPALVWPWGWAGAVAAVIGIVWATNLFNFMDGADGLAGGMGVLGFAALCVASAQAGFVSLAVTCAALASACVGFLAYNFPPARVFLGDCGSIPLGFLAATLGLYGALAGAWPAWFPLLVFSPFVVDATATLLLRLARAERVWIAHRSHGYQRLLLAGWTHRRLALCAYSLMSATAASALAALRGSAMVQCGIIFFWAAAFALLAVTVGRLTRRKA